MNRILFALVLALPAAGRPHVPPAFSPNEGQAPPHVRFVSHGPGPGIAVGDGFALLSDGRGTVSRMEIEGSVRARWVGEEKQAGVSNYLLGRDASRWVHDVSRFTRVRGRGVYPGVDIIYYGTGGRFEFDFVVAPEADPGSIRLRFPGVRPSVTPEGELAVGGTAGAPKLAQPVAYQEHEGRRETVAARFLVDERGSVRFGLGEYDRSLPLVIDPVLVYSTFLTASNAAGASIAADTQGNAYVAGTTDASFLAINGYQNIQAIGQAAFVAKLTPTGEAVAYATYFGGVAGAGGALPRTAGLRITVDSARNAYLAGTTNTTDLPVLAGAAQGANRGGTDYFVAKFNSSGNGLVYATYVGGSGEENPEGGLAGLAVDAEGAAFLAGGTASTDFPVRDGAAQRNYGGGASDAFVVKISPQGWGFLYGTYIGGSGADSANAVALDGTGGAVLAGSTASANFPVTAGGPQRSYGGGTSDAFVARLDPAGSLITQASYHGGAGGDVAFDVAVNATGIYAGGITTSRNLPVTAGAAQGTPGGSDGADGFVVKWNATVTGVTYSTYLGGEGTDYVLGLALDGRGRAVAVGGTQSVRFPVTGDAFQGGAALVRRGAGRRAAAGFLTVVAESGASFAYSTYFGGDNADAATGVAVDAAGNAYVTGLANSVSFPRTLAVYEPPDRTGFTAPFAARFRLDAAGMILGSVVSAASYQAGLNGVVAPGQIVVLFGQNLGPAELRTLRLDANGRVATELDGVRVTFDGVAAPLIYVSERQLSAVVPYGVPLNGKTTVEVTRAGGRSNSLALWVAPALVGIFTSDSSGRGQAAVLNQDGTVNSPSNPAARGSIIVLFATGAGRMAPDPLDGEVTGTTLPRPVLRIFAQVDGRFSDVEYAGAAPGLVAGVLQMNVRIPEAARTGDAVPLRIGGMDGPFGVEPAETVSIAIR